MPKPSGSDPPPKSKKRKLDKTKLRSKKKKPSPQEELSNVCNITGIGIISKLINFVFIYYVVMMQIKD
jgi:preprotein translocase subunit Sss1